MTPRPRRIQRQRTRGWTAPLDTQGRKPKYVGRPTLYGNPFQVARVAGGIWVVFVDTAPGVTGRTVATVSGEREARQTAVDEFRAMLRTPGGAEQAEFFARQLHGRDLMCWCPEGMPCHADVLLALAAPASVPAAPAVSGAADSRQPRGSPHTARPSRRTAAPSTGSPPCRCSSTSTTS